LRLRDVIGRSNEVIDKLNDFADEKILQHFDAKWLRRNEDSHLMRVLQAWAEERLGTEQLAFKDSTAMFKAAPGLTVALRTVYRSMGNSVGKGKRKPLDSDFVDGLHAVYAPYVDIFRADGYMAPLVQGAVSEHGTEVVANLLELPAVIQKRLEAKSATW
jgi:hypothetical protein